jgi:hypothetical protein
VCAEHLRGAVVEAEDCLIVPKAEGEDFLGGRQICPRNNDLDAVAFRWCADSIRVGGVPLLIDREHGRAVRNPMGRPLVAVPDISGEGGPCDEIAFWGHSAHTARLVDRAPRWLSLIPSQCGLATSTGFSPWESTP